MGPLSYKSYKVLCCGRLHMWTKLVMIGQKLRPVSQKMWQFHLNMNIEGTLWRHAVTSLVTSSLWKSFWWMIYRLSFYTCCQIEAILKTAKFFKLTKIWGPGELFRQSVTGSMLYESDSKWHSLHFELLIEVLAKKRRELWQFQNLAYFLTWWPSFVTYLIVQVTCRNQWPSTYMDPIWWWFFKAFVNYAWQCANFV